MWLIHYVSKNIILNQEFSQKYNINENIHIDNNKINKSGNCGEKGITYMMFLYLCICLCLLCNVVCMPYVHTTQYMYSMQ